MRENVLIIVEQVVMIFYLFSCENGLLTKNTHTHINNKCVSYASVLFKYINGYTPKGYLAVWHYLLVYFLRCSCSNIHNEKLLVLFTRIDLVMHHSSDWSTFCASFQMVLLFKTWLRCWFPDTQAYLAVISYLEQSSQGRPTSCRQVWEPFGGGVACTVANQTEGWDMLTEHRATCRAPQGFNYTLSSSTFECSFRSSSAPPYHVFLAE